MNPLHELQDTLLAERESGLSYTEVAKKHHLDYDEARNLVIGAQRRRSRLRAEQLKADKVNVRPQAHEVLPENKMERATRLTGEFCDRAGRDFNGHDT